MVILGLRDKQGIGVLYNRGKHPGDLAELPWPRWIPPATQRELDVPPLARLERNCTLGCGTFRPVFQ